MGEELKVGVHTSGPWHRRFGCPGDGSPGSQHEQLCNGDGVGVVILQHDGSAEGNANVHRIVSCVNACEGLNLAGVRAAVEALEGVAASQPYAFRTDFGPVVVKEVAAALEVLRGGEIAASFAALSSRNDGGSF